MAKEIERKFLVTGREYRDMATTSHRMAQGYIPRSGKATVRVRISDDRGYLTIKGPATGFSRDEWEYPIPVADAREMLERVATGAIIEKTRYIVPFEGHRWEVDEFHGFLEGLVVAEIELPSEDTLFAVPPFCKREVTDDPRYRNAWLSAGGELPPYE